MLIDVDDYNIIRTRDRLHRAKELLVNVPSAFQTAKRIAISREIDSLIQEIDLNLDLRIVDEP